MVKEGQVRIPSGCAIAAVISKEGKKMSGQMISNAMKPMHDRSNGLGGGFAGYGIYPESVSYTHLDVYKRQPIPCNSFTECCVGLDLCSSDPLRKGTNVTWMKRLFSFPASREI